MQRMCQSQKTSSRERPGAQVPLRELVRVPVLVQQLVPVPELVPVPVRELVPVRQLVLVQPCPPP